MDLTLTWSPAPIDTGRRDGEASKSVGSVVLSPNSVWSNERIPMNEQSTPWLCMLPFDDNASLCFNQNHASATSIGKSSESESPRLDEANPYRLVARSIKVWIGPLLFVRVERVSLVLPTDMKEIPRPSDIASSSRGFH